MPGNRKKMIDRKGYFKLQYQAILEDFEVAKEIFKDVIVIRAENCFVTDTITYWAYSKHFDKVPMGTQAPEYEAIVTRGSREKIDVEWRKINDQPS